MPLSTFLNGRTVVQPRGAQWLSFTDSAVIQTRVNTSDSGGGASVAWSNVGTASCRIYPVTMRAHSQLTGGQVDENSTHFLALPTGVNVDTSQRVVIANRGTFEVTLALHRTDSLTNVVEVIEVDG